MDLTNLIIHNLFSFVGIVSLIVFIHEFGHFYVARLCGVRVEAFSIGFGPEICGFEDKKGTRWKFCILPFGGYVKMYGDRNGASMPDAEVIKAMSAEEKKISFVGKNVYQRMAIVAAGPIANFILTIAVFTTLFHINGLNTVLPIVDEVLKDSAAFEVGLKSQDEIVMIDGNEVKTFDDVRMATIAPGKEQLHLVVRRNDQILEMTVTPKVQLRKDFFGDEVKMKTIGIVASKVNHQDLNVGQSFIHATKETYRLTIAVFKALGELVTGKRDLTELGGPVKIAHYSGKTVNMGMMVVLWFIAMISLNLGVMNLLPLPVLDGGHLFYYAIEATTGKPLPEKVQRIGFQFGLSVVLALMVFTTVNDIWQMWVR